jgi:hypothetical protein
MSEYEGRRHHEWTLEALLVAGIVLVLGALWHFVIQPLLGDPK